jgi:hypothetical protein
VQEPADFNSYAFVPFFFAHRARAAFRVMALRSSAETPAHLALPPVGPPVFPPWLQPRWSRARIAAGSSAVEVVRRRRGRGIALTTVNGAWTTVNIAKSASS